MSLESLLHLWDLSSDKDVSAMRNLTLPILYDETSGDRSITTDDAQHCSSCGHVNGSSQCWCDECGCSLLTQHTPATTNGVNKCSRREVHESSAQSNKPLYISVKRRWPKANFYMWRKPSTLNRSVHPLPYDQSSQSVTSELLSHCDDVLMSYTLSTTPPTSEHNATTNDTVVSDSRASYLERLPSELLINILSYLSTKDLRNCMMVCKRFYQISIDPALWRVISLKGEISDSYMASVALRRPISLSLTSCTGRLSIGSVTRTFTACAHRLKTLTIDGCQLGPGSVDMILTVCSHCCPHLTHVSVTWSAVSDHSLRSLAANCNGIKSFSLLHVSGVTPIAVRALVASKKQSLRTLNLHLHPPPADITELLPLDKLPLVGEFGVYCGPSSCITANTLHHVHSTFPNLNTMTVYCIELTEDVNKLLVDFKHIPVINIRSNLGSER